MQPSPSTFPLVNRVDQYLNILIGAMSGITRH